LAEGRHPCKGKHWKLSKEAIAARKDKFIKKIGMKLLRIPEACVKNNSFKKVIKTILKGEKLNEVI